MHFKTIFVTSAIFLSTFTFAQSWKINHSEWSETHNQIYKDFITRLGNAVKDKKHHCNRRWRAEGYKSHFDCFFNDPQINRWRKTDPKKSTYYADCADCAYVVRSYVAYKNNLPFSFASSLKAHGGSSDPRYSSGGNSVRSRYGAKNGTQPFSGRLFAGGSLNGKSFPIINAVSTAQYRVGPVNDDLEIVLGANRDELSDFYPKPLSAQHIEVGDVFYDYRGHAGIIHNVNPDGNIEIVQCHTHGFVSYKPLEDVLVWSKAHRAGGIKGWRPQKYINGEYVLATNEELIQDGKYSVEQYAPTNSYEWNGKKMKFLEFIRTKISGSPITYDPIKEFTTDLQTRCSDLKERADAVVSAVVANLDRSNYPWSKLPEVIYQTHRQPWENISTPARDLRIRSAFVRMANKINTYLDLAKEGSDQLVYDGDLSSLKADLEEIYRNETQSCLISYENSNGVSTEFNLDNFITQRLWTMSFDPYHCVEQRWGAQDNELASCSYSSQSNHIKNRWYQAQSTLRNTHIRHEDIDMSWSLPELEEIVRSGKAEEVKAGFYKPFNTNLLELINNYE